MTKEEIKSTVLNQIQQVKEVTLLQMAETTKVPLIQVQWAAKVLEEEGYITSEKTEAGKILRLSQNTDSAKTEKASETKEKAEKSEKPKFQPKAGRDTTKYIFEKSEPLPKGQCVLAVLKAYVRDQRPTLKDLKAAFDDSIVQRYGITQILSDAQTLSAERARYFLKDDQIIKTKDGKSLACTTQWTAERFADFIKLAKNAGYSIKAVA